MKSMIRILQVVSLCVLGACADTTEITDITPSPEFIEDEKRMEMSHQQKMEKLREIFPEQFYIFDKSCSDVKETVAGNEIQSFQIPFAGFFRSIDGKAWGQLTSLKYQIYLDKHAGIRFVKFNYDYHLPPGNERMNGGGGFFWNPSWTFEGEKLVVNYGETMGFYLFVENGKTYLHSKTWGESVEVTATEIRSSLVELPFCK